MNRANKGHIAAGVSPPTVASVTFATPNRPTYTTPQGFQRECQGRELACAAQAPSGARAVSIAGVSHPDLAPRARTRRPMTLASGSPNQVCLVLRHLPTRLVMFSYPRIASTCRSPRLQHAVLIAAMQGEPAQSGSLPKHLTLPLRPQRPSREAEAGPLPVERDDPVIDKPLLEAERSYDHLRQVGSAPRRLLRPQDPQPTALRQLRHRIGPPLYEPGGGRFEPEHDALQGSTAYRVSAARSGNG